MAALVARSPVLREPRTPGQDLSLWKSKLGRLHLPTPPDSVGGTPEPDEPLPKRRRMSNSSRTTLPPINAIMSRHDSDQSNPSMNRQQPRSLPSPSLPQDPHRSTQLSPIAPHPHPTTPPTSGSVPFLPFPHTGTTRSPYHAKYPARPMFGPYPYFDPRFPFSFPGMQPYPNSYEHGKHGFYYAPFMTHSPPTSRSSSSNSDRSLSKNNSRAPAPTPLAYSGYPPHMGYPMSYAPGMPYATAPYGPYPAYPTDQQPPIPPISPRNVQVPQSGLYPPSGPPIPYPYAPNSPTANQTSFHYPPGSEHAYTQSYEHAYNPWQPASQSAQDTQRLYGGQKRRRGNLPKETTETLRNWLNSHQAHPYPTEEEKQDLARQCNLTVQQISNWFINARRRKPGQSATAASTTTNPTTEAEGEGEGEDESEMLDDPAAKANGSPQPPLQ